MFSPSQLHPLAAVEAFGLTNTSMRGTFVGFSGATVWQIDASPGLFALKAYPSDWNDARHLSDIHRYVIEAGATLMPQPVAMRTGVTVIECQSRLWEMMDWREGTPATDVGAALEAAARLHGAWRRSILADQPCPAVARQWAVLGEWDQSRNTPIASAHLMQATSLLARLIGPACALLRPWLNRPVPMQTIHGDLWMGNVLMHNGRVSGIVDCAAVRVDSVVSDLSRLCGTTSVEINRQIADGYEPLRPLQPMEWELLKTLGRTGPVARLAQWLKWLVIDRRDFVDWDAALRRFAEVVAQARQLE